MNRLSRWHLIKIIIKSLFANGMAYSSEAVKKESNKLSCDSFLFESGNKFYIIELTVIKTNQGGAE